MELRQDAACALLVPTSMGVRITPVNGQPVHCSDTFVMQATSAETNVASIASYLGLPVKVLTTFVKGSPIARFIKDNLASRHMAYEGKEVDQGGPWGYRHQFNIADSGYGSRGPRVHNDRAGEVGRTLNVEDFDLDRIFGKEGVQIVHLSGLIGALSPETGTFCLELARAAKKHGTRISFDLNYRASFWKGREKELAAIFAEIAGVSDILVGNEEDFQLCLGIEGPEAGGKDLAAKIEGFKGMIERVKKAYPNASGLRHHAARGRQRQPPPVGRRSWPKATTGTWSSRARSASSTASAAATASSAACSTPSCKGWEPEKWVQFGWASGALATTLPHRLRAAGRRGAGLEHLEGQRPRAALTPHRPPSSGVRAAKQAGAQPGSIDHPDRASSRPSTRGRDSSSARVTQRASSASSPGTGSGAGTCRGRSR